MSDKPEIIRLHGAPDDAPYLDLMSYQMRWAFGIKMRTVIVPYSEGYGAPIKQAEYVAKDAQNYVYTPRSWT